jgi:hypothetical protein
MWTAIGDVSGDAGDAPDRSRLLPALHQQRFSSARCLEQLADAPEVVDDVLVASAEAFPRSVTSQRVV